MTETGKDILGDMIAQVILTAQQQMPTRENALVITNLEQAHHWNLQDRRRI